MKFRRQDPIGVYVLDFYCAEAKLAVEVDGAGHGNPDQAAHDRRRTDYLIRQGVAVLRVIAEDVRVNLGGVLESINEAAKARVRGQEPLHRFAVPLPIGQAADGEET